MNINTVFSMRRTISVGQRKHLAGVVALGITCILMPSVVFAQNTSTDPDPDVEKGAYLSLNLDQNVVAVGSALTGTAKVYEGDGDIDSDDSVSASLGSGSSAANAQIASPAGVVSSGQSGSGTVNFSFPTSAPGDFNITATTADVADKSVPGAAIGGAITGDNDVKYYCDYPQEISPLSTSETGQLTSASGQPTGTTYQWSISGPCIITTGQTAATATFRSTGAGTATATVTYSLKGVPVNSQGFSILTHMPKISSAVASGPPKNNIYYPNDPYQGAPYYGFDNQKIVYTIVDQNGAIMSGVPVEEVFRLLSYDVLANNNWPIPEMTATTTGGDGKFTDFFSTSNYSLSGLPGDPTVLKRPDSEPIAYLKHSWYAGPSKANIAKGCQLENYQKVTYSTNGVTGD